MKHDTTCAHCGTPIIGIDTEITNYHAHSMVIIVQRIDSNGYSFYQCDGGQKVHRHTYNYWHCSRDHMMQAMPKHITNHVVEGRFQSPAPGNIVNLHLVLDDGLQCEVCGKLLIEEAYRIQLWHGTPIAGVPEGATNSDEEGWCCSLAHAKQQAHNVVTKMSTY